MLASRSHVFVGFGPVVVVVQLLLPLLLPPPGVASGQRRRRSWCPLLVGSLKTGDPIDARTPGTAKPLWTRARPDEVRFLISLPPVCFAPGRLLRTTPTPKTLDPSSRKPTSAHRWGPPTPALRLRLSSLALSPAAVRSLVQYLKATLYLQHRGVGSASAPRPPAGLGPAFVGPR